MKVNRGEEKYIITLDGLLERVELSKKWHYRHGASDVRYQSHRSGRYYTHTVARAMRREYASLIHQHILEEEK